MKSFVNARFAHHAVRRITAAVLVLFLPLLFLSLGAGGCFADEPLAPLVPAPNPVELAPLANPDLSGEWTVILGDNSPKISFSSGSDLSGSFYDPDTEDATINFDAQLNGWTASGTWSDGNGEGGTCTLDAAPADEGAYQYSETWIKGTFHKSSNDSDNYYTFVRYPDLTITAQNGKFTVSRPAWDEYCILPVLFNVGGTATYGVDYTFSGSGAKNLPGFGGGTTIPYGQTSVDIPVTPATVTAANADDTVVLTLKPANPVASSATESGQGFAMPNYNVGAPASASVSLGDSALEPNPYSANGAPGNTGTGTGGSNSASAGNSISVTINGQPLQSDVPPFINSDGRTMLPVGAIAKALGASVQWDDATKTATLTLGTKTVEVTIGQNILIVDGAPVTMDTVAVIQDGRTFLPVRAVGEALGAKIGWDAQTRTVSITN
jgi:hypothetical protein